MVQSTLELPFFDDGHRALSAAAEAFVESLPTARHGDSQAEVDQACRDHVKSLGGAGLLRYCVRGIDGGALTELDSRSLCILRQRFAHHDALLDFAFAMQGLGSGALSLAGESALRAAYLPRVARGQAIAAFALSEPNAGSDVAALECRAFFDAADGCYVLDGEKTFISNGGIADFYTVFARTGEAPGARGLTAFVVDAESNGLRIAERIEVAAPHPLARLSFEACRVPLTHRLGAPGGGFKLSMMTLDIFRTSVAAAALGLGRRAVEEASRHAVSRRMFGATLADLPVAQSSLGDAVMHLDAAELLTYRAAYVRDVQGRRTTSEAAMAKLAATEWASSAIDTAVQMFGGRGVCKGEIVERLNREIRALRIYEGASEVQRLIIAREHLRGYATAGAGTRSPNGGT